MMKNLKFEIKILFNNFISLSLYTQVLTLFVLFQGLCISLSCYSLNSSLVGTILGTPHILCLIKTVKIGVSFFHFQKNSGSERLLLAQIHITNIRQRIQTQIFLIPNPCFLFYIFPFHILGWGLLPIYKNGNLRWFILIIYKYVILPFVVKKGIH